MIDCSLLFGDWGRGGGGGDARGRGRIMFVASECYIHIQSMVEFEVAQRWYRIRSQPI